MKYMKIGVQSYKPLDNKKTMITNSSEDSVNVLTVASFRPKDVSQKMREPYIFRSEDDFRGLQKGSVRRFTQHLGGGIFRQIKLVSKLGI
jgi:hypothetical protein